MTDQLPDGLELVRTTEDFDHDRHPAGLRSAHRVADGVWARLLVRTGQLGFVFEDDARHEIRVTPDRPVVIPPGRRHHIELDGTVTFAIEFHGEPGGAPPAGRESTALASPDSSADAGG